jgi:GntR family transcriptional repressor for pyruvate dehydrogenase complex
VTAQKLKAGDQLPTERALEAQLGVSRPVVREAFRVLETSGIIVSRQGGGRYLLRNRIPTSESIRKNQLDNSRASLLQLWDAREAVQSKAAELAAINATKEQINEIFKTLDPLKVSDPLKNID